MFDMTTLTVLHTAISLIATAAGFVVVADLMRARSSAAWLPVFLVTAFITSASGFLFPFNGVLPSHVVGVLALVTLVLVVVARRASPPWRGVEVAGLVASQFFLVFVGVAQLFTKVPAFQQLAPTQSEPPFAVAVLLVLGSFVAVGIASISALRRASRGLTA
ncbi:hypothetical protein ACQW02_06240 [Humitalea sp. 24SJ18S-53]|uniref:hypothetical protein n=1 Tax=Humitalea sp. 24SJ18S-53 TaxID=3422307 RepID=UPI003D66A602